MAEYMESPRQPEDPKPPKPYASVAQIKRCDGLVAEGKIAKEIFEHDLMATNLEGLIWRKGPAKEEDGTPEQQAAYIAELQARKAKLVDSFVEKQLSAPLLPATAAFIYNPLEGLQDGSEGLEAGKQ